MMLDLLFWLGRAGALLLAGGLLVLILKFLKARYGLERDTKRR